MDYQTFGQQYGQRQRPDTGGFTSLPVPRTQPSPYKTTIQQPSYAQTRTPYQAPPMQPGTAAPRQTQSPYQQPQQPQQQPQAPQPQQPQYNSSAWDTNGYAAPQYIANRANARAIPGWNGAKWEDPNHQSPKYVVGRILSQFAPRTENMPAAFGEIQRAYPAATFNGKDLIDLDGPGPMGPVDVLQGASVGGKAWRWGANDGAAPQPQAGGDNIFDALLKAASGGFAQQEPQQPAFDPSAFLEQFKQLLASQQQSQGNGPRIVWG